MKKILFPLLLLASIALHAQTVSVTLSNEFTFKEKGISTVHTSVSKIGDFFYNLDINYKGPQLAYTAKLDKIAYGLTIHKYDVNMKEASSYAIGKGKEFGPFPAKMAVYKQGLAVLYYQVQEDNSIKLLVTIVDPATLTEKLTKELYTFSQANVGMFKMEDAIAKNKLFATVKKDGDKILVCQAGSTSDIFTCVINSSLQVEKSTITAVEKKFAELRMDNCYIDDNDNICCGYSYTLNKVFQRGIFAQNNADKKAFADVPNNGKWASNIVYFHQLSKTPGQLLVYANYYGDYLDEGLLVTSFNTNDFTFGKVNYFSYPDDIREKMTKMDYGQKNKSAYTVRRIDYVCNELEDGTFAFSGAPLFTVNDITMSGRGISTTYGGPLVNFFVKNDAFKFNVIYRNLREFEPSGVIAVPYKNKIVMVYNDGPANITIKDSTDYKSEKEPSDLVLAAAVISNDGRVASKKVVSGVIKGSNYYYTTYGKQIDNTTYIIPVGRQRISFGFPYTELVQWGTVVVQ